nr:hypothetical protein [uncultured Carboxylicivirga sp.]
MTNSNEKDFFAVAIIESLREGDKKTGEYLHTETLKYKKFQEENLTSLYYCCTNKNEFLAAFKDIIQKNKENYIINIVHIECHGSNEGLQLGSGEFIKWKDFFDITTPLNIQLANSLLLVIAACKGNSIIGSIDPEGRAPFKGVIGSFENVGEVAIRDGFEVYYDNFFFTFDFITSLEKMNEAISKEKPIFHNVGIEWCYDQITNPERDANLFKKISIDLALKEKNENPKYRWMKFRTLKRICQARIREDFRKLRKSKAYFMMEDLESHV